MLIFKFDNSDLDAMSQKFHKSFEMCFGGMADADINEYIECFRAFLIAQSFPVDMVDDILGLTEEKG